MPTDIYCSVPKLKKSPDVGFRGSLSVLKVVAALNPNKLLDTFSRFLVFIVSSFFIVLTLFSIINQHVLINLYIDDNKNVIVRHKGKNINKTELATASR